MEQTTQAVTIENMGVLDLTGKKLEDLSAIGLIQNVGVILAPQELNGALMQIPQKNIGMTVSLPETSGKFKLFTGQLMLSGDVFANPAGSEDDVLVIAGQVIITSPVEKVGFAEIIIAGQLIAPKKSEAFLAGGLSRLSGQIAYYHADAPRFFVGNDSFSRAFFELIDDKMTMALVGSYVIEDDVDAALLKQKVSELLVIGSLTAPKALIPLLQLLATTKIGDITGRDDAAVQGEA